MQQNIIQHIIRVTLLLSIAVMHSAYAVKPIYSGGKERAAIRGYDPVAYFTDNRPVKGKAEISLEHQGATWFFASEENRQMFQQNPKKYTPQYGGYCAYAVARNKTASIRPEYFTIHDGKLYLNFSESVNDKWIKDKEGYIENADQNWPDLVDE